MARISIKSLVPKKNSRFIEGYYRAIYPEKYIGDSTKIIFRSSWEKKFMTYCDVNVKIVKWSSETIQIPYLHPINNKISIYNMDFFFCIKQDDNTVKNYIGEVKPAKKLIKPVLPTSRLTEKRIEAHNIQMKEYIINMHKFNAAKQWAADRGWEFMIITEKFLF